MMQVLRETPATPKPEIAKTMTECSFCMHPMKEHFVMMSGAGGNIGFSIVQFWPRYSGICLTYACLGSEPVYWVNGEHDDEDAQELCPCNGFVFT